MNTLERRICATERCVFDVKIDQVRKTIVFQSFLYGYKEHLNPGY